MSDFATSTFVGVLVAVFLAIRYWRMVIGLVLALLLTILIMGVYQVVDTMQHTATNVPVQSSQDSHQDGGRA
ncbi:MAG TPA: hypothetical protein VGJ95_01720 [Pseudonocardiaceae bacterium]